MYFDNVSSVFHWFDGILPKGPYPPCLRMTDRALLAGYHRIMHKACALLCFAVVWYQWSFPYPVWLLHMEAKHPWTKRINASHESTKCCIYPNQNNQSTTTHVHSLAYVIHAVWRQCVSKQNYDWKHPAQHINAHNLSKITNIASELIYFLCSKITSGKCCEYFITESILNAVTVDQCYVNWVIFAPGPSFRILDSSWCHQTSLRHI